MNILYNFRQHGELRDQVWAVIFLLAGTCCGLRYVIVIQILAFPLSDKIKFNRTTDIP